jgi:hypothetical protein
MNAVGSATIAGAAFDPQSGRIYLTEAYGDHPAVHVYAVGQNTVAVATTTRISASPASARFGATVTLSATVIGNSPSGTVTFKDGARILGTGSLSNGSASMTTSTLSVGYHLLTAGYGGDAANRSSTSPSLGLVVTKGEQAPLFITASPPTLNSGGSGSVLRAEGGSGNGTVRFTATGSAGIGCFINGSSIRATGGNGICRISATKSADGNYNTVTSAPLTIAVVRSTTATLLTSAPNPSTKGQSVIFRIIVSGGSPTGQVQLREGTATLGYAGLSNGQASWSGALLATGTHAISAHYAGDVNNGASVSETISQVVNKRASQTMLTSSPNPARLGRTVILSAMVLGAAPTGSFTFRDGETILGVRTIISGWASIVTSQLSVGTHLIGVSYSGDANHAPSHTSVSQIIRP